uniref:Zygote arrest protein 1 n=1 Tax=Camelus bactrianus TaxID=9837 RepID=A0A9W3F089_CAMBA|nr:zygote arrest protein 1 [Camelus bactrianus]
MVCGSVYGLLKEQQLVHIIIQCNSFDLTTSKVALGERGPPPARPRGSEEGEGSARKTPQGPQSEEEDEAQAAVSVSQEQSPPVPRAPDAADERSPSQSPQPGKERLRFQFLEQKYGYYHCKDCNIRWESAYVWCVQGTNKVYYKQFCRTCQKSYNPYRVEDIVCQNCKQTRCSCPVKLRHVDPKRPHRQDLCGRCKGKRLSCDSTFSFKYIIVCSWSRQISVFDISYTVAVDAARKSHQ